MLENPYGKIPLEAMVKTTPRDIARTLAEHRALASLESAPKPGGGGGNGKRDAAIPAAGTGEEWARTLKLCAKEAR